MFDFLAMNDLAGPDVLEDGLNMLEQLFARLSRLSQFRAECLGRDVAGQDVARGGSQRSQFGRHHRFIGVLLGAFIEPAFRVDVHRLHAGLPKLFDLGRGFDQKRMGEK